MKHLLFAFLLVYSLIFFENKTYAQIPDLNTWIDAQLTEGMSSSNIAGLTIIVMQGDSILHMNGYGLADIASNTPVDATSSIFGVGSISKTFVATAIMQLYEDGKLELDRDVNNYLTTFQLEYKFNDSVTVRHLLTHTSGLDESDIGSSVIDEKDIISLSQYLKKHIPTQIRPSGKVKSYSNKAFVLLGLIVEEVSGLPCKEYIRQRVLSPLEMDYSSFRQQVQLKENYVTGYVPKGQQLIPVRSHFELDYPAGGLKATASDMGHYISMFLNDGSYNGIQILDSTAVDIMLNQPFRHYEKAKYGSLLGFQERDWHGMQLYGHTGSVHGFESQLLLIPDKNIGIFISANSSNYNFSKSRVFIDRFINGLLTRLMSESKVKKEKINFSPKMGTVDEPLEEFTGTYRYTQYGYNTLEKLAVLLGLTLEIEIVAKDSTLEVLPFNDKLVPISDLTFHFKHDRYMAFGRNTNGEIAYFFNEAFAFEKLKWYEPIKFQMLWIGSIILIIMIYIVTGVVRKIRVRNKKALLVEKINFSLASLVLLFIALLAFALKTMDPLDFIYGVPLLIELALVLPFFIIPLVAFSLFFLIRAFLYKELTTLNLICQSLINVVVMCFIPWLMYYNLIGFNY